MFLDRYWKNVQLSKIIIFFLNVLLFNFSSAISDKIPTELKQAIS